MARPEEIIEKRFVKKCAEIGVDAYKFEVHGNKGAPDRMVLLPKGRIMFFEFKRPGGGLVSAHQEHWIRKLQDKGFVAEVVDSWEYPLNLVRTYLKAVNAYE